MKYSINKDGLELIKWFEGLSLKAYKCPANVWTIGYGHTGFDVSEGMLISTERAEELLKQDLEKFENIVNRGLKVEVTENQFSALVSLCYNIGGGAFLKSTALRKVNLLDFDGAVEGIKMWNKAGGRILAGLVNRRNAECILFVRD